MKCKYKKTCENYRKNSYTCNKRHTTRYCGIFKGKEDGPDKEERILNQRKQR
jgi:hypothetical protein